MIPKRLDQMLALAKDGGPTVFATAVRDATRETPIGNYVDPDALAASLTKAAGPNLVVKYDEGSNGVKVTVCPKPPPGKDEGWGLLAQATTVGPPGSDKKKLRAEALLQAVAARLVEEAKAAGRAIPDGGSMQPNATP